MATRPTKLRGIVILLLVSTFGMFPARALRIPSLRALSFKQALDHPPLKPQRLRVLYSASSSVSTCRRNLASHCQHAQEPGLARKAATPSVPFLRDFRVHGTAAPLGHPLRC